MRFVKSIHISPVKSLGLIYPDIVHVGPLGIEEDRRFYLINGDGDLLTQREIGTLVQIKAEYQKTPEILRIIIPNGDVLEGALELGKKTTTAFFGRSVEGQIVNGGFGEFLSEYCRHDIQLIRSDGPGQCYDEYPIALISQASLDELTQQQGSTVTFDSRRFRPSFLIDGCQAHEEDAWIDHVIQIGTQLRLRLVARDPRCAITTLNPSTGVRDSDTLRLILGYRPNPQAAYFGVYGIVERPGNVSVGDQVMLESL